MEVIGLLGPMQDVIDTANKLKERYEAYEDNVEDVDDLICTYMRVQGHLASLKVQCEGNQYEFPHNNYSIFISTIKQLERSLTQDTALLQKQARRMESRLYRMARAKSTAIKVSSLKTGAEKAENKVMEISRLLGTAAIISKVAESQTKKIVAEQTRIATGFAQKFEETAEHHADTLLRHQSKGAKQILQTIEQKFESLSTKEAFSPVLGGQAVPSNPPRVVLDLNAKSVERKPSTFEAKLKAAVLKCSPTTGIKQIDPPIVAARGPSGVGKSCALRALARDGEIMRRFPDGIFHIQLGKDATVDSLMQQLCDIVEISGGALTSKELRKEKRPSVLITKARLWVQKKCILLLVDDAWSVNDIDSGVLVRLSSLLSPGSGSCLALTTRDRDLGMVCGDIVSFFTREVHGSQSRDILLCAAGFDEDAVKEEPQKSSFNSILDVCAGLPVALAVSGNTLRLLADRYAANPGVALRKFCPNLNCRSEILNTGAELYEALSPTLSAALDVLDSPEKKNWPAALNYTAREMHRALAVLQKQAWAPIGMLQRLWGLPDAYLTLKVMEQMENAGVAELEMRQQGGEFVEGLRIHDLVHDYCQKESKHDIAVWHRRLLNNYEAVIHSVEGTGNGDCRQWWTADLEKDGYLTQNLCRHLIGAELLNEAINLLLSPQWTAKEVLIAGILQLGYDYKLLASHVEEANMDTCERELISKTLRTIFGAASLGADYILQNPKEIWFQLYGRILPSARANPTLSRYLEKIEGCAEKPWIKPLSMCLPSPGGSLIKTMISDVRVMGLSLLEDRMIVCGVSRSNHVAMFEVLHGQDAKQAIWQSPTTYTLGERYREGDEPILSCVDCSRDGKRVVIGFDDGTLEIWDILQQKQLAEKQLHTDNICCVSFVTNGTVLASGADDNNVCLWNAVDGTSRGKPLCGHTDRVNCLTFSGDGKTILSGSSDTTLLLWDTDSGRLLRTIFSGHDSVVLQVAFSPDGKMVTSGCGGNGSVRVFEMGSGKQIGSDLSGCNGEITSLAFSDDGQRIAASGSQDDGIIVWDLESDDRKALHGHTHTVSYLSVLENGTRLVSGSYDCSVRYWDLQDFEQDETGDRRENGDHDVITNIASSIVAKLLVLTFQSGKICLWNAGDNMKVSQIFHPGYDSRLEFSDNGRLLAVVSWNGRVMMWNTSNGTISDQFLTFNVDNSVSAMALSKDGSLLITAFDDGNVLAWQATSGKQCGTGNNTHAAPIDSVAISACGKLCATGSRDGAVGVWDMDSWEQVGGWLLGHTQGVRCASFSPDERLLTSGSEDGTVRIWSLESMGQVGVTLKGHTSRIYKVTFLGQGLRRVVSQSSDRTTRLWNFDTGACLAKCTDTFCGMDITRYGSVLGTMADENDSTEEEVGVRFSKTSIMLGTTKKLDVLATIEFEANWHYFENCGIIAAVTDRGVESFRLVAL